MYASQNQLADLHINSLLINSRIIMADGNTCKWQIKQYWTQEQLLLLNQLIHGNKNIIKGKCGVEITSETKDDTLLIIVKCFYNVYILRLIAGNSRLG